MKEKSQFPNRILFIVAVLIVLSGSLISATLFKASGIGKYPIMIVDAYREEQHHLTVPGSREIKLTRTGAYGIYYEYNLISSAVGPKPENPPQIECTLKSTSTGTMIQAVPDYVESNTYWSEEKGGIGVLIMSVTLDEPGIFDFSCQYKDGRTDPEITVSLGPNYVWEFFRVAGKIALSTILGLTTCCGSTLIGLAIIVVIAIRSFRRKTAAE
jgi:hypothetical protein